MMSKKQQMVIGALIHPNGSHTASWLMQEALPHASTNIDYYRAMAQTLGARQVRLLFIADTPAGAPKTCKLGAGRRCS